MAVLSIALGLAANTAVFSFVLDVCFRPLPLADPDSLVLLWSKPPDREVATVSADNFLRWRHDSRSFAGMSAIIGQPWILSSAAGPAERAQGLTVSADFFDIFRLKPVLGRRFAPEDFRPGGDRVAVLSHGFWRRHFGGDPGVLGQSIRLSLTPYTVIGVLAPENTLGGGTFDVFTPLLVDPLPAHQRSMATYVVHARLKPGVSRDQAQAEMNVIAEQLARAYPETNRDHGVVVRPIQQWIGFNSDDRRSVLVLFAAVGCVQLIVCANLANCWRGRFPAGASWRCARRWGQTASNWSARFSRRPCGSPHWAGCSAWCSLIGSPGCWCR